MDFLKNAVNNAGEDAIVDQAANYVNQATGGDKKQIIDQASSYIKKTIDNEDGSQTTTTKQTTDSTLLDKGENLIK